MDTLRTFFSLDFVKKLKRECFERFLSGFFVFLQIAMEKPLPIVSSPFNVSAVKAEAGKRIAWLDMAKGVLLLAMVYLHYPCSNQILDRCYILTIVMPCFFIVSGILSKWRTPAAAWQHESKGLLLPYFGLAVLGTFVTVLTLGSIYGWEYTPGILQDHLESMLFGCRTHNPLTTSGTLWFLMVLFEIRMVLSLSYRFGKMRTALTWLVISFSYLLIIGPNEGYELPRNFIDTFMICSGCYCIGLLVSPVIDMQIASKHLWMVVIAGTVIIAFAIYTVLPSVPVFDPRSAKNLIGIHKAYMMIIPTAAVLISGCMLADRHGAGAIGRFLTLIPLAALAILEFHLSVQAFQQYWLKGVMPGHIGEWYVSAFLTIIDVALLTWAGLRLRKRWPKLFGPR